jgi:4-amino-4-deoxy-L-arabinose transferase-like glycosyltransferase
MGSLLLKYMKINKFIKEYWLLILALLVGIFLRLWKLGSTPPQMTTDEVALGYNAYSILKTGKDEYGKVLPLIFKSYGDFKPGLYIYFTVPSVALLGLNEFATRLPSAVSGIFSILLVFLIVKKLFSDKRLALISAFIAAINPWLIFFSRGAWEANLSLALTLAGIYFFLLFLEKPKYLILSALFFGLTFLTYQGAKLSSALVLFSLVVAFYKKEWFKEKKYSILSLLIGLIISLPVILSLFQGKTGRLAVFSVFSYPRPKEYIEAQLNQGNEKIGSLTYYLFHSETYNFLRGIMGRYFNNFSGKFLFFEGDYMNQRHSSPYQGQMLLAEIIILILGLSTIVKNENKKSKVFIFLWLILAPLSAALSRDQISAVRTINFAIPLIIISAYGLNHLLNWKGKYIKLLICIFALFYLASFCYYLDSYFIHLPKNNDLFIYNHYKELVEEITPIQNNYKLIEFQQSYAQPYMYFLFYSKYDPSKYQKQNSFIPSNFSDVGLVEKLDNIKFVNNVYMDYFPDVRPLLLVGNAIAFPKDKIISSKEANILKEIKYLDGSPAFYIVEVK